MHSGQKSSKLSHLNLHTKNCEILSEFCNFGELSEFCDFIEFCNFSEFRDFCDFSEFW